MRLKTTLPAALVAATLLLSAPEAGRAAIPVFDPLNYAQNVLTQANTLRTTLNQARQIAYQLQELALQVQSLRSIPKGVWGQIRSDLDALRQITATSQTVSYADTNLSRDFEAAYSGFSTTTDYAQAYQRWAQNALGGLEASLEDAGLQDRQLQSEDVVLSQLQAMSDGATGHLQALQVANMLAVQQIGQLQKLRQLQMAQIQALADYLAAQQQTQSSQYAALKSWLDDATRQDYKF